ncbi:MAG: sialate O-acetylesterase [Acidobacteriota bacterium]|nr:sialate O-acetylesterase [Acidobacteriota bacterium]
MRKILLLLTATVTSVPGLLAELKLPAIVGDHMVLQQNQANPIWGWDTPGTNVTVSFARQHYSSIAGSDGRWTVTLNSLPADAKPQTLTVEGSSRREIQDVLIGEVWMCSGQSNMGFTLARDWNGDLEAAASDLPGIRLIQAPLLGTQELQSDFRPGEKGQWRLANPATAIRFSAIGFLFGRYLHQILHVPVGLIDNAWGGSSAEAWVRRSTLEQDARFQLLMESTVKRETTLQSEKGQADFQRTMDQWKAAAAQAIAEKTPPPPRPEDWLAGQHRPGNIFAGVVSPTLGYGIKGVIWYQGEANAGRAYEYKTLFPFLIEQWRKEQGQANFPFYWVQLADFNPEKPNPGDSSWAELREAQTQTMKLPNTGQAVIIDLGEGKDIHPRNKHDVAARLVRWALVQDYGMTLPYRSPEFKSMAIAGNRATITFDMFGGSLRAFDVAEARGFAICGADQVWHLAQGKVVGKDRVEVWSDEIAAPVAVRYGWADNPVLNLFSDGGLPVTPFRTDDFSMTTAPKPKL